MPCEVEVACVTAGSADPEVPSSKPVRGSVLQPPRGANTIKSNCGTGWWRDEHKGLVQHPGGGLPSDNAFWSGCWVQPAQGSQCMGLVRTGACTRAGLGFHFCRLSLQRAAPEAAPEEISTSPASSDAPRGGPTQQKCYKNQRSNDIRAIHQKS